MITIIDEHGVEKEKVEASSAATTPRCGSADVSEANEQLIKRPMGIKKMKQWEENERKVEKMENILVDMKEEMKRGNLRSSQNFEELLDIQLWEKLPQGEEKDELLRDIVAERREKRMRRKAERNANLVDIPDLTTTSPKTCTVGSQYEQGVFKGDSGSEVEKK